MVEIRPDDWTLYHVSTISRIAVERLPPARFAERYDRIRCNDPNRLVLFDKGGITPYSFTRVVPSGSSSYQIDKTDVDARLDDPKANLAVFWQYFQDNYAFFRAGPVAVDWVAIGAALDARLAQAASREDLRAALEEAIRLLKDAHVRLVEGGRQIAASVPLKDHTFLMEWARAENIDVASVARGEIFGRFRQAGRDYVSSMTREPAARVDLQQQLLHGWLTADIGYIAPLAFVGLTAKAAGNAEDDRLAMHGAMDWFEEPRGAELIGRILNARRPGSARVVGVPGLDHHFTRFATREAAFRDEGGRIDADAAVNVMLPWLQERLFPERTR